MPQLLWDASALSKRYYREVGSDTVNAFFSPIPARLMAATYLGYAETAAILRRKANGGVLNLLAFQQARLSLDAETLLEPSFELISVDDPDVLSGVALTDRHNLNSTDAAILAAFLKHAQSSPSCLLIAADRRLIRASVAEGLPTFNPEDFPAADVPALFARS